MHSEFHSEFHSFPLVFVPALAAGWGGPNRVGQLCSAPTSETSCSDFHRLEKKREKAFSCAWQSEHTGVTRRIWGHFCGSRTRLRPIKRILGYRSVCAISVCRAVCVHAGTPSCHFNVFAVRLGERLRCTSAIPVCLSVSSDSCLCPPRLSLPPLVTVFLPAAL